MKGLKENTRLIAILPQHALSKIFVNRFSFPIHEYQVHRLGKDFRIPIIFSKEIVLKNITTNGAQRALPCCQLTDQKKFALIFLNVI